MRERLSMHRGHIYDRAREECAELIMAICKARRFGLHKYHPAAPELGDNEKQIRHEIADVRQVCDELERFLGDPIYKEPRDAE